MIKDKISTDGSAITASSLITLPPQAKKAVYFYFPERSGSSLLSGFAAVREINQSNNNKKKWARTSQGPGLHEVRVIKVGSDELRANGGAALAS